jgi:hypothetical protein
MAELIGFEIGPIRAGFGVNTVRFSPFASVTSNLRNRPEAALRPRSMLRGSQPRSRRSIDTAAKSREGW